jgi:hypothetical protein
MGRYNVSERNRLPKFNAEKNPFAPKAAAQTELAPSPAPVVAPVFPAEPVAPAVTPVSAPVESSDANSPFTAAATQSAQSASALSGANWLQRAQNAKSAATALIKGVPSLAMKAGGKVAALGNTSWALCSKLIGRAKRVRRKEPASVIPRLGKPAVQGELSLDNVRVLRNDLEESDLEIVTAQTSTSAQVAPSVPPVTPNRGPMPAALKKLTNRITGVNVS